MESGIRCATRSGNSKCSSRGSAVQVGPRSDPARLKGWTHATCRNGGLHWRHTSPHSRDSECLMPEASAQAVSLSAFTAKEVKDKTKTNMQAKTKQKGKEGNRTNEHSEAARGATGPVVGLHKVA